MQLMQNLHMEDQRTTYSFFYYQVVFLLSSFFMLITNVYSDANDKINTTVGAY